MSEYTKGRKAWLESKMTFREADKQSQEFQAGFRTASKLFRRGGPIIKVPSQMNLEQRREAAKASPKEYEYRPAPQEYYIDEEIIEKLVNHYDTNEGSSGMTLIIGKTAFKVDHQKSERLIKITEEATNQEQMFSY
jgi:hypothetical protein